ncbi:MAG: Trm112 family protein [Neomegalonema sp.]|nr:Trm112 family protein [Neomegalonema sp.]
MDIDPKLLESLICPVSQGALSFDREKSELISRKARLAFPIRDGVPIMLESEARILTDEDLRARP